MGKHESQRDCLMNNTIHVQYKINPSAYDEEKEGHDILLAFMAQGHSSRYIHTQALRNLGGITIGGEISQFGLVEKLRQIEKKIDNQTDLINAKIVEVLRGLDLSQYVSDSGRSIGDELGGLLPETMHQTIASGIQGKKFNVD